MRRTTMEEAYRGGRVEPEIPTEDEKPKVRRYPCFANGCPMAGTLWPDAVQGGTGEKPGACPYHYAVNERDIPRVTNTLQAWQCVTYEVQHARTFLRHGGGPDARAVQDEQAAALARLRQLAGQWEKDLCPTGMSYSDWAKHLERFLGARVVEALSVHHQRRQ